MRQCNEGTGCAIQRREWPFFIRDPFARATLANEAGSPKGKSIRDLGSRMTFPVRGGLPKASSRRRATRSFYKLPKGEAV